MNNQSKVESVQKASARTWLSPSEQKAIIDEMNSVRSATAVPAANMRSVTYNPELQTTINNFVKQNGGRWFNIPGNKFYLMQMPGFEAYSDYQYMFHDTCGNQVNAVSGILAFRGQRQRGCFSYQNCDPNNFNNYYSCGNTSTKVKNCNWWFQYYPVMVDAQYSNMACSLLGVQGVNNFNHQPNSFVCYGKRLDENGQPDTNYPTSDQPFVEGERCSKCPSDANICSKNALCTPSATATEAGKTSILPMFSTITKQKSDSVSVSKGEDDQGLDKLRAQSLKF